MLNAKTVAAMDQARAEIIETLPKLWWGLFDECVKQGFTRQEALFLVIDYVRGAMRGSMDS